MSLRFFADHCIPNAVIQTLRNAGHQVFVLKEHIAKDSPDSVVIAKAQELNAILVTLNGDFADIVTYPPSKYKGIVALQVKNHPEVISAFNGNANEIFLSPSRNGSLSGEAVARGSPQDQD